MWCTYTYTTQHTKCVKGLTKKEMCEMAFCDTCFEHVCNIKKFSEIYDDEFFHSSFFFLLIFYPPKKK